MTTYRETPPCVFCGHREHLQDVCEQDLGEFGECACSDPRTDTLGPCGCRDYHMADCPIRSGESEIEP